MDTLLEVYFFVGQEGPRWVSTDLTRSPWDLAVCSKKKKRSENGTMQSGPLEVINGVITPINGLIIGFAWSYNPTYNW